MKTITALAVKEMLESGANNLSNKHEEINTLNVFPVPDGDTGTNMWMTYSSGMEEVNRSLNNHVGLTVKALSKGMLMGARGNSGVILSQIIKGIYKTLKDQETCTVSEFAAAVANGSKVAYKAVMKPVEGTILTVIRESGEAGEKYMEAHPEAELNEYLEYLLEEANASLKRTPDLLPVLAEVGVVDSGGAGLVAIFEGFYKWSIGQAVKPASEEEQKEEKEFEGYCVELTIDLNTFYQKEFDQEKLLRSLAKNCDKVKVVKKDDKAQLHLHTFKPGDIINLCQRFGEFSFIKVENMNITHDHHLVFEEKPREKYAIITVCTGSGIEQAFKGVGVEYIVSGGQTMNPATEDFVSLIREINAENIFILPNNSNIIMAANQTREVLKKQNIIVIETKTIPQGLAAAVAFNPDEEVEANRKNMIEAMNNVRSGSVTFAVKDTSVNGVALNKNDFMGLSGKEIISHGTDLMQVTKQLLDGLCDEDSEFITLIYGKDVNGEQVEEIKEYMEEQFDCDYQLVDGQQDLYSFIIGVE